MAGQRSNFRKFYDFSTLRVYISKTIYRSGMGPSPACSPFISAQNEVFWCISVEYLGRIVLINDAVSHRWRHRSDLWRHGSVTWHARQGVVKHGFVSKIAGGCSSYDVIAPWPDLTWSIFFYQKLRKVCPISFPKTRRRYAPPFFRYLRLTSGGGVAPTPPVRARVKPLFATTCQPCTVPAVALWMNQWGCCSLFTSFHLGVQFVCLLNHVRTQKIYFWLVTHPVLFYTDAPLHLVTTSW